MEYNYIVSGFYQKRFYIKSIEIIPNFGMADDDIQIELTDFKSKAYHMVLNEAVQATKYLKHKGFLDISIDRI